MRSNPRARRVLIGAAVVVAWVLNGAEAATDSVVTINEVMYHPADPMEPGPVGVEWIEVYNPMSIRVDVSGWSLRGRSPGLICLPQGQSTVCIGKKPLMHQISGFLGCPTTHVNSGDRDAGIHTIGIGQLKR